jgi:hypothetical protein
MEGRLWYLYHLELDRFPDDKKQTGRINILTMYHCIFILNPDLIPSSLHLSVLKVLTRNEIPRGAKIYRVIPGPWPGVLPV